MTINSNIFNSFFQPMYNDWLYCNMINNFFYSSNTDILQLYDSELPSLHVTEQGFLVHLRDFVGVGRLPSVVLCEDLATQYVSVIYINIVLISMIVNKW